jgi:hypothetical protein
MTLAELLDGARAMLGPEASAEELTDMVLSLAWQQQLPGALFPAVRTWVADAERMRVRGKESTAFDGPAAGRSRSEQRRLTRQGRRPYVNPAEAQVRQLLEETCYVEGHGMVRWGDMTVRYHEIRADFLARVRNAYVAGVNATIARHQAAVAALQEADCATLDEYAARNGSLPDGLSPEVTAPA